MPPREPAARPVPPVDWSPSVTDLAQVPPRLVEPGEPLTEVSLVSRPAPIRGLRSWSIESRGVRGGISAIAVSPNGKQIAASGTDGIIRLYDAELQLQKLLPGHASVVLALAWSADGGFLASGSRHDQLACVWDTASGRLLRRFNTRGWTEALAWSPDRQSLVVGTQGVAVISPCSNALRELKAVYGSRVEQISWCPDGSAVSVSGSGNGLLTWIWATQSWNPVTENEKEPTLTAQSAAFSPDRRRLAYWTDKTVRIVEWPSRELVREIPFAGRVQWSPSGNRLLIENVVVDASSGEKLAAVALGSWNRPVAWLDDDHIVSSPDEVLTVWAATTGAAKCRASQAGRRYACLVAVLPDGKRVVTKATEGRVWDSETGELVRQVDSLARHGGAGTQGQIGSSPASPWIATGRGDAQVFNAETGETRMLGRSLPDAWRYAWSPDGRLLARAGSDKKVRIWDVGKADMSRELEHTSVVLGCDVVPDGKWLVSCIEGAILLWNADNFQLSGTFDKLPDGASGDWRTGTAEVGILCGWGTGGEVVYFRVGSMLYRLVLSSRAIHRCRQMGGVRPALRLSPDGSLGIVFDYYDDTGRIEVAPTNERLKWLSSCTYPRWLPDSRRLVIGNDDHVNLHGFDVQTGRRLGVLLPSLPDNQYICIGPDGHYRGSKRIDEHIVYVAMHEDGSQVTYTPQEFREKFGWQNDPNKARFLALDPPNATPPNDRPLSAEIKIEHPRLPEPPRLRESCRTRRP